MFWKKTALLPYAESKIKVPQKCCLAEFLCASRQAAYLFRVNQRTLTGAPVAADL